MAGNPRRQPRRRKTGEGSFRTRKNGTVEYRVSVGSGEVKSFYGATQKECLEKYHAWVAANPDGPPTIEQRRPLNDLLAIWVDTIISQQADSTYRDTNRIIKQHIAPTIGKIPINEVTLYAIDSWLADLKKKTGRGRTIERCRDIVRAALNYAVKAGTLTANPAEHATVPSYVKRKATALTFDQARALIDAAAGRLDLRKPYKTVRSPAGSVGKKFPPIENRLVALYVLALSLGLRKGELLGLRWNDLQGGSLSIRRFVDTMGDIKEHTKTEASAATIELDQTILDTLEAHRKLIQAEDHQEGWKPDGLVFPTSIGTIMSQRNLDRHFKNVLAAAGLPNIRFHDLRHSAGTLMIEDGHNLANVSAAMRHANPSITAKIYLHGNAEGAKRATGGVSKRLKRE